MQKLLGGLLLLIIILVSGCSHNPPQDQAENKAWVLVAESKEEILHTQFSYQAVLQPAEPREICAQISGVVKAVHIKEGELVNSSDLLLELDAESVGLALNNAQQEVLQSRSRNEQLIARFKDTNASLQRQQMLYENGAVSRRELEKDQLELELLQHDIAESESQLARAMNRQRQAELDLNNCRITAPDNMIVSECLAEAGQYVKAGQALIKGGKSQKLQMVIEVPGEEAIPWKIGAALSVSCRGEERGAVISHISNQVLAGTSRIEAVLEVDNQKLDWKPGEWATVSMVLPQAEQITVPLEAVAQGGSPYVYVVKDGQIHKQVIELGTAEGSRIAVKGIEAGALVVKGGLPKLRDGQRIDFQKEAGSQ